MGQTTNYGWDYGVKGEKPWFTKWQTLWNAVDTELYSRTKDLLMPNNGLLIGSGADPTREIWAAKNQIIETLTAPLSTLGAFYDDFLMLDGKINFSTSQPDTAINGLEFSVYTDPSYTGDLGEMCGIRGYAMHLGSGNLNIYGPNNKVIGAELIASNEGVGIVDSLIGVLLQYKNTGAGSVVSTYGLYVYAPGGNNNITNAYGVYIADQNKGANKWNIYSAGATSRNQFEGKIMLDSYLEIKEMSAPSGISDKAIIFSKDNGAGKTQLMVIFPTGVAQQIAIKA
jgi:hypothetical protein